jgi:hypothetical protein
MSGFLRWLRTQTGKRMIAAAMAGDRDGFRRAWTTWCRIWEIELLRNRLALPPEVPLSPGQRNHRMNP